ncbi:MAG: hypothetical protein R3314_01205 [Longimicrobiales bacterium]|nr:hypothetical protein [Longimicrobiales bacterium]
MSDRGDLGRHGVVGGLLAATAIVVFFLIVDLAQGQLFQTPRFLAGVLMGTEVGEVGFGLIALYTVIHYAVFAVVGVATAWVLRVTGAPASVLLGLVVGFLLFDLIFYAGVTFTGVNVVERLGWPWLLAGNLLGGVALMLFLARSGAVRSRRWTDALAEHQVVREGLIAGVIGAVAVAAWFFVVDLGMGRLLYTPGALGSALFMGVDSPEAVRITASTVLGYTGVHFAGFIAMGMVFSALVTRAEESPPLLMGLALLFVTFETLLLGLVAILAAWLLNVVPWWSIAASNLVAATAMVAYLWRVHPALGELDWGPDRTPAG